MANISITPYIQKIAGLLTVSLWISLCAYPQDFATTKSWFEPQEKIPFSGQITNMVFGSVDGDNLKDIVILSTGDSLFWFEELSDAPNTFSSPQLLGHFPNAHKVDWASDDLLSGLVVLKSNGADLINFSSGDWAITPLLAEGNISSLHVLVVDTDTIGFATSVLSNSSNLPRGILWFERDTPSYLIGAQLSSQSNTNSIHASQLPNGNIIVQGRDSNGSIYLAEKENGQWNTGGGIYLSASDLGVIGGYPEYYASRLIHLFTQQIDRDCLDEILAITEEGDLVVFDRDYAAPGTSSWWTYGHGWHIEDFSVNQYWRESTTNSTFAGLGTTPLFEGVFVFRDNAQDRWQPVQGGGAYTLNNNAWDEINFFGLDDSGIQSRQNILRDYSSSLLGMAVERSSTNSNLVVWGNNFFQVIQQTESNVPIINETGPRFFEDINLENVTQMSPVDFDRDGDLDLVLEKTYYIPGSYQELRVFDGTTWLENVMDYSWQEHQMDNVVEYTNNGGYCGYSLVPNDDGDTVGEFRLVSGTAQFRSNNATDWETLNIVSGGGLGYCSLDRKKEVILQYDLDGDGDNDLLYWTVEVDYELGGTLGWLKNLGEGNYINYPISGFSLRWPEMSSIEVNPLSGIPELICRVNTQPRTTWSRIRLDANAGFPVLHFNGAATSDYIVSGALEVLVEDSAYVLFTAENKIEDYSENTLTRSILSMAKISVGNVSTAATDSQILLTSWGFLNLKRLNDQRIAIIGNEDYELSIAPGELPLIRQSSLGEWKGNNGAGLNFYGNELPGFQSDQLSYPFSQTSSTPFSSWSDAWRSLERVFDTGSIPQLPNFLKQRGANGVFEWIWTSPSEVGCANTLASNYDPLAAFNHKCEFECIDSYAEENELVIGGCTSNQALNFNDQATYDNGTCTFPTSDSTCQASSLTWSECLGNGLDTTLTYCFENFNDSLVNYSISTNTEAFADFITIIDAGGDTLVSGSGIQTLNTELTSPCFEVHFTSDASVSCVNSQGAFTFSITQSTACPSLNFEYIVGCTDPNACNFNPNATSSGLNSCEYPDCSGICGGPPHFYDPFCGTCYPLDSLELLETEVFDFEFTGDVQVFNIPDGAYKVKIEAWGAQGGGDISITGPSNGPFANGVSLEGGGPGGYVTGTYGGEFLNHPLFIVVGEFGGYQPIELVNFNSPGSGTFNGGGASVVLSFNGYIPSDDNSYFNDGWPNNSGEINDFFLIAGGGGAGYGNRIDSGWSEFWNLAEGYSGSNIDSLLFEVASNTIYWNDFGLGSGGHSSCCGSSYFAGYYGNGYNGCSAYELPPSTIISALNPVDWDGNTWCINDPNCLYFRDDWEAIDGPGFNFNRLPAKGQSISYLCWTPWWDGQFQQYELNGSGICDNPQSDYCASEWIDAGMDWILDFPLPMSHIGFNPNDSHFPSFGGGGKGQNFNVYQFNSFQTRQVIGLGGGGGHDGGSPSIYDYESNYSSGQVASGGTSHAPGLNSNNEDLIRGQRLTGIQRGHGKVRLTVYYEGLDCEPGCTDELACNYNEFATEDDDSCEYETCLGCTDAGACNFHPANLIEDDSCEYETCASCGDSDACNFDAEAIVSDLDLCEYMSCAGCLDPMACNYDASATIDAFDCTYPEPHQNCAGVCFSDSDGDGICDELEIGGCTYPFASNYNPLATDENGTCLFNEVTDSYGCTYSNACNFDSQATADDGSCEFPELGYDCDGQCLFDSDGDGVCNEFEGCTNPQACNFDPQALDNDGTCLFALAGLDCDGNCINDADSDDVCDENEIAGCTDFAACNFNGNATDDDGSCSYATPGENCAGECLSDYDNDGVCDEFEVDGCTILGACNFQASATENDGSCYFPELFQNCAGDCMNDSDGDGVCDELEVAGCTYPWADNFNPLATNDDGGCEFMADPIPGCIYPTACNYQPDATQDNGSCIFAPVGYTCSGACIVDTDQDGVCDIFEIPGCQNPTACNYNSLATDASICNYIQPGFDCDGNCLIDTNGDGICDPVEGCTNPLATNYNEAANQEDGSCSFICNDCAPIFTSYIANSTVSCVNELPNSAPAQTAISPCDSSAAQIISVLLDSSDDACSGFRTYQHLALNLACGNFTIAYETISVAENSAPEIISLPENLVFNCSDEIDLGLPVVVDACSPFELTFAEQYEPGACPSNYTINRTVIATDVCGNTSNATYQVSVIDTIPPTFHEVSTPLYFGCEEEIAVFVPSVSDDCGDWTITHSDTESTLDCPANRLITRVYIATDACGNSSQSTQLIHVLDTIAPEITSVPNDLIIDCDALIDDELAAADDQCSEVMVWLHDSIVPGNCPQEFIVYREHIAEDACGNGTSAQQVINVVDTVPPGFYGSPIIEASCEQATSPLLTSVDNCGASQLVFESTGISAGEFAENEVRIYTAIDDCGNEAHSIQLVSYSDGSNCGGCMDPQAQNFNEEATFDDGSCVFCSCAPGTIWDDALGSCVIDESALIAACGEGTYWNPIVQACVSTECAGDLNGDNVRGVADLLLLLSLFGSACE